MDLDKVSLSFLDQRKSLPLVISPRWDDSLEFLCSWLKENRSWVDAQILKFGAILIRGFQVNSAPDFERATLAVQPNLCDAYRGTSPRSLKEGTKYAFSAADVPNNYPISQHCEMSFLKSPPRQLFFGCMKASRSAGGETALCDNRKVYQDLSPELRDKFASRKVKYTRTHKKIGETWTFDVGAMLGWPQLFGTNDIDEVERICLEEEAPPIQWKGEQHNTFVQEWFDEPYQRHPETGEIAWFNHTNVFHWSTFPAELWFAFRRFQDVRFFLHAVVIGIFTFIKYGILGYSMALNSTFGDGQPISVREMNEVRRAIHKNLIFSRWQKGDILCIDNFSTSHGRQPTYDKGRSVVVAWSQPYDKSQHPMTMNASVDPVHAKSDCRFEFLQDKHFPDLVSVTPNTSPASTLTSQQGNELHESLIQHGVISKNSLLDLRTAVQQEVTTATSEATEYPGCLLLRHDSDFWKDSRDADSQ